MAAKKPGKKSSKPLGKTSMKKTKGGLAGRSSSITDGTSNTYSGSGRYSDPPDPDKLNPGAIIPCI